MSRRTKGVVALVAVLLVGGPAAGLLASAQASSMPLLEGAAEQVVVQGRGLDQSLNAEYLLAAAPDAAAYLAGTDTESAGIDPFRKSWSGTRGTQRGVSFVNRYGARLAGELFAPRLPWTDPVLGTSTSVLPGLVFLPGWGSGRGQYTGLLQSLAEAGYVVLAVDPQGQGESEIEPSPASRFCDQNGPWREAQEAGQREQGRCAGIYPVPPPPPGSILSALVPLAGAPGVGPFVDIATLLASEGLERDVLDTYIRDTYDAVVPNFVFAALDAADWLRSDTNPWRDLIDSAPLGVVGHSLGAHGALLAANGDPKHRFAAAVLLDGYGTAPPDLRPAVPTMFQMADESDNPTSALRRQPPDTGHPSAANGLRWRDSKVDAMQIALLGSGHSDWGYSPYQTVNPLVPLVFASRYGERIGVHYAQAWFDLHLRGPGSEAWRARALGRLTASRFDGSADASSIGTGIGIRGHNEPYRIEGLPVTSILAYDVRSAYDVAGQRCDNIRAGC